MTPPDPATQTDETAKEAAELDEANAAATDDEFVDDGDTGAAAEPEVSESGLRRRKRLRERASDKADRISGERLEQAREMASELRHKRDCPEEGAMPGDGDRRVEHFPATKPPTDKTLAEPMLVVRCIECGESEVAPDESEA